ncbi:MAG: FAD binding domain-containing protein [Melioribacteraceae bacterium]|nr:FAD binding domain-containing protein [Melioribacteraceae bacterium]
MINLNCKIETPKNIDELLKLLAVENFNSKILAGGTDLIVGKIQGSKRFVDTELLIDINKIEELHKIDLIDDKIIIGASTTFSEIENNKIINEHLPLLKKAVSKIGSLQIRNRATIAGNFVNNAPCADSVPPLLVYNAELELISFGNKRTISLENFLEAPYKTQLQKSELVSKIIIPVPDKNIIGDFYKLGRRRAVAISRITLAVLCRIENNSFDDIRIASGAVTPIGKRFYEIENFTREKRINNDLLINLSQMLGEEILKITGLRWSSAYKLPVVQQMFYQLLNNIVIKK